MYNNLKICVEHIFRVNEVKYLGMYIDDTLTWKGHIDHVIKSVSKYFDSKSIQTHCILCMYVFTH